MSRVLKKHFGKILLSLLVLQFGFLVFVFAGEYFNKDSQVSYSVSDCDKNKNPQCLTFYIDGTNGNDLWNGLSPEYTAGTNGPFKTINKALDRYSNRMKGGNVFKIKAGTYYERITVANVTGNVSEDTRLVLGSYGNGEVIIDASDTNKLIWTKNADNPLIYEANYSGVKLGNTGQAVPQAVVLNNNYRNGRPVDSISEIDSYGKWFYYPALTRIYIHTNGEDPVTHNILVVKKDSNTVETGIYISSESFITVAGLTIRGAGSYGVWAYGQSQNVKIENNNIVFSGKGAVKIEDAYGEIIKNNIHGNILLNWPRGTTWDTSGGWPPALFSGKDSPVIRGNIVDNNGGEGIIIGSKASGGLIEDNKVFDNWSVNIYLDHHSNALIKNNLVYCTGPVATDAMDIEKIPSWTTVKKIYRRLRPDGIITADEDADPTTSNISIYNNIVNSCATGFSHYAEIAGSGIKNFSIFNNTIIVPPKDISETSWSGITIPYNSGYNSGTAVKNNIIYGTGSDTALIWIKGGINEKGVLFDNNLYYNNNSSVFWSDINRYDFGAYKVNLGQDAQSIFSDPKFKNISFNGESGDLLPESPAIDAGIIVDMNTDFYGNIRPQGNKYDIGAIEYVPNSSSLVAFPGAQGFGAKSIGGRGGKVIKVTNLNDGGPGSFREAVAASGARVVTFDVSGIINLETDILITNPYLTIAGQTSPGGILITGRGVTINTHDVIIRHMRFRPGSHRYLPNSKDAETARAVLLVSDSVPSWFPNKGYNIIVDHSSLSWAIDQVLSTGTDATDITIQNSIISEGLSRAGHPKGEHSKGVLIDTKYSTNDVIKISMHHNYIAHNQDRNPLISGTATGLLDAVNNVVYNFGGSLTIGTEGKGTANWIHNYIKQGPNSNNPDLGDSHKWDPKPFEAIHIPNTDPPLPMVYVSGNLGPRRKTQTADEWSVGLEWRDQLLDTAYRMLSPWPAPSINTSEMSEQVAADIVSKAGATMPARDSVDTRVVNDFSNNTGKIIDNVIFPDDFPVFENFNFPSDSDNDGMPDTWETSQGLNPYDNIDANTLVPAGVSEKDIHKGYTYLEYYLNLLAEGVVLSPPPPIQYKKSDLNKDGKVDQLDFDVLKLNFNRTDKPPSDINQDGIVDTKDLGILMGEWSR